MYDVVSSLPPSSWSRLFNIWTWKISFGFRWYALLYVVPKLQYLALYMILTGPRSQNDGAVFSRVRQLLCHICAKRSGSLVWTRRASARRQQLPTRRNTSSGNMACSMLDQSKRSSSRGNHTGPACPIESSTIHASYAIMRQALWNPTRLRCLILKPERNQSGPAAKQDRFTVSACLIVIFFSAQSKCE